MGDSKLPDGIKVQIFPGHFYSQLHHDIAEWCIQDIANLH